MRTNVTRLAAFLGISIAVIGLSASPAFAHGDWHHRDRDGVSGTQFDPNHDGGCDHDGTDGTSAEEKAAEDEAPEAEAAPEVEADETALAATAPAVVRVPMHAARADALDKAITPMTRASSNASTVPTIVWPIGFVVLLLGVGFAGVRLVPQLARVRR